MRAREISSAVRVQSEAMRAHSNLQEHGLREEEVEVSTSWQSELGAVEKLGHTILKVVKRDGR